MNEVCLSNKNGNVIVNFPQTSIAISSIIDRPLFNNLPCSDKVKRVECESLTIDHYCNINNIYIINFIKIDVEGAEKMVLEGAKNMFAQKKIKGGMIEIIESQLKDAGTSSEEIEYFFKNYGYNIVKTLSNNDWYFHI
jgi:FkbM family methyltransferase